MLNALTIDVEDYYMVSAFADRICFTDWDLLESRVERSTHTILDLLNEREVKVTFFVLGWVAKRFPALIREIESQGHEIASHGFNHRLVYNLSPEEFRADLKQSRDILENITGVPVLGYRAASYSIVQRSIWALDILIEEGFVYDSSVFPVYHDRYGMPGAKRHPHVITRPAGSIIEFPPATLKLGKSVFPVAGGGYLRLLPMCLTRYALRRLNEQENQIAVVYLHPWEVDTDQPRINGSLVSRFRHYVNLDSTLVKLRALLTDFEFGSLRTIMQSNNQAIYILDNQVPGSNKTHATMGSQSVAE
ncbi:MAG: XrtA system polysaccharide deacetylase [Dissulfurispiraceae bacterium]|jgi:polysaccharide deacetylase family protein (PEP-CTERM system associated)